MSAKHSNGVAGRGRQRQRNHRRLRKGGSIQIGHPLLKCREGEDAIEWTMKLQIVCMNVLCECTPSSTFCRPPSHANYGLHYFQFIAVADANRG